MLDKLDAALRFQQEALNLRAQRQKYWRPTLPMPTRRGTVRATLISPVN